MHCSLRRFLLTLAIVSIFGLLPGLASGQEITTFGSQANTNDSTDYVKANRYDVTSDVNLDQLEIRYRTYAINRAVTFAVWQADANGVFQVIWQESHTINSWDWTWSTVTPDIPLEAGESYAMGMWFGTNLYYAYGGIAPGGQPSWGTVSGGNSGEHTSFPNTLNTWGWFPLSAYHQRLTVSYIDDDGDGFLSDVDCDDTDSNIYPGAVELCDGQDTDCDGALPADELDVDSDGLSECEGDCDDGDGAINPSAAETCNSIDDNCDGAVDEGLTIDGDADGFTSLSSCQGSSDDCDDSDSTVHPGALEICNGADDNCDGEIDEGLTFDVDQDGHTSVGSCAGSADDCADEDDTIFPGAPEICDDLDNDCDGELPADELDADTDGYRPCDGDCDDTLDAVWPGATEDCANGIDDNCDGSVDEATDEDGDGFACDDCDDTNADVFPGAEEAACDGFDTDCDGELHPDESDIDGDGLSTCDGDCDDADPGVYPGAKEDICDEVDMDCDGALPTREGCGPPAGDDDDGSGSLTGVGCQGCYSISVEPEASPRSLFALLLILAALRRWRRPEAADPTDAPPACS